MALLAHQITQPCGFPRNDSTTISGNPLGYLEFGGNDATSALDTSFAYVGAEASGTHAAGDNPTDLVFGTTADGSATVTERMRIDAQRQRGYWYEFACTQF